MASRSGIEWTEVTWNPVTGCDRVSAGCDHCYALTLAKRLKAMGAAKYQQDGDPRTSGPGFAVKAHPQALDEPYRWRTPRVVFVNSMSDLFHARVPLSFVREVFGVITDTPQHTYQVLTKRSLRLRRLADQLPWPPNLWMGVSVENAAVLPRVSHLRQVPAVSPVPVLRAAARPVGWHRPDRHRLGHRRRRIRPELPADAAGMGARDPRRMSAGGRAVLLQAVGWPDAQVPRPRA